MTRPTETARDASEALRDADAADWLDARPRAALLFWDATDAASQRLRARVEVAAAAAGIALGTIDIRSDPLVAHALGVDRVPALVVFRGGEVVERVVGAAPDSVLQEALR